MIYLSHLQLANRFDISLKTYNFSGVHMKLISITWAGDVAPLLKASKELDVDLIAWSISELENRETFERCIESLEGADLIILHPSHDSYWDEIIEVLDKNIPTISFGRDPAYWSLSNLPMNVISKVSKYVFYGGSDNISNMLRYVGKEILGLDYQYSPPEKQLWQGIYHPDADNPFESVDEYLTWYKPHRKHCVGILFFRTYWANDDLNVVNALIRELEKSFDVIPAFCFGMGDREIGAKSSVDMVEETFIGRVDALINLQSIFHSEGSDSSRDVLKRFDVPVFHPLTLYHTTEEEWLANSQGMRSMEVGWSVAMPEFEGVIETLILGVAKTDQLDGSPFERHEPVEDRLKKIVNRVGKWIDLNYKPPSERKVAFILHNSPCASVEANVGAASHLDSLESLARILTCMTEAGYTVGDPPKDRDDLIRNILDHKAISEFRWTTVNEIVTKGGSLALVSKDDYGNWFETLPIDVQSRTCEAWGRPPGEEKDGVPAAMVYDGKIVVTGIRYGNMVVCVQPKRGCAGSRCDGRVCKILHDPLVPPPHQYLATYRYLEEEFGADVIVHVGTHGNLEFLPGKSVALSSSCYPDIVIGNVPHLYIYNSDNSPEGTIAKRRSYATLVDHMQTVMTESGLYGELKELEDKIAEYNRTRDSEKARAHAVEHLILNLLKTTNLYDEMKLEQLLEDGASFESILEIAHEKISEIYNTQIPDGMHIFGEVPQDERKVELINSILKFDSELRKFVSSLTNLNPASVGDFVEIDAFSKEFISAFLAGEDGLRAAERILGSKLVNRDETLISFMRDKVFDLSSKMESSDEMGGLFHGFGGGYIVPGPSGLITRGKPEVLPTGRNFFSLDPTRVPTEAAWGVGCKLADGLILKYKGEHGRIPENVAMYWMSGDIMWADGEQLAQMMYLIGVEPIWKGGSVRGYRVLSLEELGRPRIDLTIRVSEITRDCFYNCIEFLDQAIREVASLNEPPEQNYLRKRTVENGEGPRIFASPPGTYGNGVKLAVYASAWEGEKDLSDVFIYWNGYAYGKGVFGEESHDRLISQLKSVDLTFNKTVTDEYDLLGCCCYFGTHGGLTTAAREISKKDVSAYYGDTRDLDRVAIRSLADEVRRVVRTKLLNPKWIEGMKRHGYKGAGDISKRVGRVYGWEATTQEVDDWIFDDIAKTFILDDEMRKFFEENNPWALEEMGRRLLEAHQRGLWKADEMVIDELKDAYLEMEGWLEEKMGDIEGDFQGGSIDVVPLKEINAWKERMSKIL